MKEVAWEWVFFVVRSIRRSTSKLGLKQWQNCWVGCDRIVQIFRTDLFSRIPVAARVIVNTTSLVQLWALTSHTTAVLQTILLLRTLVVPLHIFLIQEVSVAEQFRMIMVFVGSGNGTLHSKFHNTRRGRVLDCSDWLSSNSKMAGASRQTCSVVGWRCGEVWSYSRRYASKSKAA